MWVRGGLEVLVAVVLVVVIFRQGYRYGDLIRKGNVLSSTESKTTIAELGHNKYSQRILHFSQACHVIMSPSANMAKLPEAGTVGQINSLFFVLTGSSRKSRLYKATFKGRDMSRVRSSWFVITAGPDFHLLRGLP